MSGVTDYFATTEEEGFEILRDTVATLNIPPQAPVSPESEEPGLNPDDLNGKWHLVLHGNCSSLEKLIYFTLNFDKENL